MAVNQFEVRAEGPKVVLIINGVGVPMPWEAADEIAKALRTKAREAEEYEKANGIAQDAALLLRLGVPVGLSNQPDIRGLAEHLAQYDPQLRRYVPAGVKAETHFGTPIIRHER